MYFFWNRHNWKVVLKTDALPDQVIGVGAIVQDDRKNPYVFYEWYQAKYHVEELNELVQEKAKKYFDGKYCIYVEAAGNSVSSNDPIPMMSLSEFSDIKWRFNVIITIDSVAE